MYHPAAAFRQGSVMRDFEEDFKKFRLLVDQVHEPVKPVIEKEKIQTDIAKQLELI